MNKNGFKNSVLAIALVYSGSLWAAPMSVVSSFSILGDVAQQIGGERVAVTSLVPADGDAHGYQLTGGDLKKLSASKLILLNGLGLESGDVVKAVQNSKVPYAEATAGISPIKHEDDHDEHEHHHEHGHHHHHHHDIDPHVWHDPVLMQKYAANITQALIKADPAGAQYYQARFQDYSAQLIKLDTYARQQFNAIPSAKRKILTGHDAFSYLGKRYQVQFIAPEGVSTEAQPSAKTVASIIRQIKTQGIKAIFTENIKDGRMVQRIAQETGAKVGGKLYSDALSRDGNAKTYTDLFRYNVRVMSDAMK